MHENRYGRIKTVAIEERTNDLLCRYSDMKCYKFLERTPSIQLLDETSVTADDVASISEEIQLKQSVTEKIPSESLSKFVTCRQFGIINATSYNPSIVQPIDQGVLVCRDADTGWYPSSMFSYNNTECSSFKMSFGIRKLDKAFKNIEPLLGMSNSFESVE